MSIRMIARELYRLERELSELESRLEKAQGPEKDALMDQLRMKRAERQRIKDTLEGAKEQPPYRLPR
ncbi:MAG: hypothetical protein ACLFUP_03780 [Desulfobacteraceae bacterium]